MEHDGGITRHESTHLSSQAGSRNRAGGRNSKILMIGNDTYKYGNHTDTATTHAYNVNVGTWVNIH